MLNEIACCRRKRRKKHVIKYTSPVGSISGVINSNDDVEMGKVMEKKHSTASSIVSATEDEENEETWKEIARALDRIFFWLFLILLAVSSIAIYSQAGRLTSADVF